VAHRSSFRSSAATTQSRPLVRAAIVVQALSHAFCKMSNGKGVCVREREIKVQQHTACKGGYMEGPPGGGGSKHTYYRHRERTSGHASVYHRPFPSVNNSKASSNSCGIWHPERRHTYLSRCSTSPRWTCGCQE
jgi:hypothetical protein